VGLDDVADPRPLVWFGQPEPGGHARLGCVVTGGAAEDEVDGGQQLGVGQVLDDLDPPGGEVAPPQPAPAHGGAQRLGIEAAGLRVGPTVDDGGQQMQLGRRSIADHVQVVQLDRPPLLDDRLGGAPHGRDPLGQLGRVRHGGRKADQADRPRGVDDDLLPHRAPVGVLQVVDLVEDDVAQVVQGARPCIDHVAEHLGRHHHDGCVTVDGVVAGEQPDPIGAESAQEVAVLLVRQRLDRGGVERLGPRGQRHVDRVLGHERLACAGRRGHQHRLVPVDGVERHDLELVELEVDPLEQLAAGAPGDVGHGHAGAATVVARRRSITRPATIAIS
jgi:hypothetical protein